MNKVFFSCVLVCLVSKGFSQKINGKWRGEFVIQDSVEVPFTFLIDQNNNLILINGEEYLNAGSLKLEKDSVIIPLNQFDNVLRLVRRGKTLEGVLQRQEGQIIAQLRAEKGKDYRFEDTGPKPDRDYSGKYEVLFGDEGRALGLFTQVGSRLTATFLKPSGDTRFQEGVVQGNRFFLSSFFGSAPAYYYGHFTDSSFSGEQVGLKSRTTISGILNPEAQLPELPRQTVYEDSVFAFSLPDANGKTVTLRDEKYKNKPVIITLTGTWCPNCMDETKFLSEWYTNNRELGVEIIAIHFERQKDTAFARRVMSRNRDRYKILYTQVFGGTTAKADIEKALPALKNFGAFPTTIFIDSTGRVVNIHSGFSGPATGRYYDEFIIFFNSQIENLIRGTGRQ